MALTNSVLWYATRGAGAVSLLLLTSVVALGIVLALRWRSPGWPGFLTNGLHRNLSLLSLVFLCLHVVTAVVDPYTSLGWRAAVIPFSSHYRPLWLGLGVVAIDLLVAQVVTSLLRGRIGYRAWRFIHWGAYVCWPVALAHGLGTGSDTLRPWMLVIVVVCAATVLTAILLRVAAAPSRGPRRHGQGGAPGRIVNQPQMTRLERIYRG